MIWKDKFGNRSLEKIRDLLDKLYPNENVEQKYRVYKRKREKVVLLFLLLGICSGICVHACSRVQSRLQEGTHLRRNEWGEGNYEVILQMITQEECEEISYEVKERRYTEHELLFMRQQLMEQLPKLIVGENKSLDSVRADICLPTQVEGFPFTMTWKSGDYEKVRTDGKVNISDVKEAVEVLLTVVLSYEEQKWQQEFRVTLLPKELSEEKQKEERLYWLLNESDEKSAEQKFWILPDKVGERPITWKEKVSKNGAEFFLLGIVGAIIAVFAMENELQKRVKKRERELSEEYPEFVSKLQLYLGAGLSVRNAFLRIGSDYQAQKVCEGKRQFVYEEVVIACHRLLNAGSEEEVYKGFAKRCDEIHYRKLAFLLISYGRQGNDNILKQLAKEAYSAWEEKRSEAKRKGEEAGTKMLLPMIMMLMVVMFLILVPAYAGF